VVFEAKNVYNEMTQFRFFFRRIFTASLIQIEKSVILPLLKNQQTLLPVILKQNGGKIK
jgi:hypothetical protein